MQDCYAQESSQFQDTSPKFIPVCYRCVTSEDFIHRVTNLTCVLFLSLRHDCWSVVGLNCEKYLRNFFQFVIIAFHLRISPRYQFVVCFFRAWGMVVCADGVILQEFTCVTSEDSIHRVTNLTGVLFVLKARLLICYWTKFQEISPKFFVISEDFIHHVTNLICVLFSSLGHGCITLWSCKAEFSGIFSLFPFHLRNRRWAFFFQLYLYSFLLCFQDELRWNSKNTIIIYKIE